MSLRQMWDRTPGHRSWWLGGVIAAVLVVAVFLYGLVHMVGDAVRWATADPNAPTVLAQVQSHDNDAGLVALFAKHCIELWAKATPDTQDSLRQCFTVPPAGRAASPMAADVSGIDVYTPQLTYKDAQVSTWSVLVSASIKEFGADSARWQFLSMAVSLPRDGGPRGMLLPGVRATGLPPGVDMELGYPFEIRGGAADQPGQTSQIYEVVKGFLTAYLCGPAKDVAKYVTPESRLATLGALYSDVTVETMAADVAADGPPSPGQRAHVLVTVTAKDASGGQKPMQYPLLVVDAAGRWAVDALEDLPVITGRMLTPGSR